MTAAISRGLTASAPRRRFGRQSDCRGLTPPPPRGGTQTVTHTHTHTHKADTYVCVCVLLRRGCVYYSRKGNVMYPKKAHLALGFGEGARVGKIH